MEYTNQCLYEAQEYQIFNWSVLDLFRHDLLSQGINPSVVSSQLSDGHFPTAARLFDNGRRCSDLYGTCVCTGYCACRMHNLDDNNQKSRLPKYFCHQCLAKQSEYADRLFYSLATVRKPYMLTT